MLQGLLNGDEGWFPSQLVQEENSRVCRMYIFSIFSNLAVYIFETVHYNFENMNQNTWFEFIF